MDAIVGAAGAKLLEFGVAGVFILVLLGLAWLQRKEIRDANAKLQATNETRITEARETARVLAENTAVLNRVALAQEKAADASKSIAVVIEGMTKTMDKVEDALDRGRRA